MGYKKRSFRKIEFTSLIDDFLDKGSISFLTSEANKGKTF